MKVVGGARGLKYLEKLRYNSGEEADGRCRSDLLGGTYCVFRRTDSHCAAEPMASHPADPPIYSPSAVMVGLGNPEVILPRLCICSPHTSLAWPAYLCFWGRRGPVPYVILLPFPVIKSDLACFRFGLTTTTRAATKLLFSPPNLLPLSPTLLCIFTHL